MKVLFFLSSSSNVDFHWKMSTSVVDYTVCRFLSSILNNLVLLEDIFVGGEIEPSTPPATRCKSEGSQPDPTGGLGSFAEKEDDFHVIAGTQPSDVLGDQGKQEGVEGENHRGHHLDLIKRHFFLQTILHQSKHT